MKTWIQYLNFRIYKYYKKKRESIPEIATFLVSGMFLYILFFDFFMFFSSNFFDSYDMREKWVPPFLVAVGVCCMAVIFFMVYFKSLHKTVFAEFENNEGYYSHWNKSVPIFIISLSLITVLLLSVADMQNHGKLRRPFFGKSGKYILVHYR